MVDITRAPGGEIVLSPDHPDVSADTFRDVRRPNLLEHQQEWYDYAEPGYVKIEDETIKQSVQQFLKDAVKVILIKDAGGNRKKKYVPFHPKPSNVNSVVEMLSNGCHRPRDKAMPPCWLNGCELDPCKIVACTN